MDVKEIDRYIKKYFLAPYRIRIIEARQDYDLAMKGKYSKKSIDEINSLYDYIEKIEAIVGGDDIELLEVFRMDNKSVLLELNMQKHQVWNYRKRVRNKILEAVNNGNLEFL